MRKTLVKKRALVTSALPYANGEIHLGHVASTYLPADVTVRHLRQLGVEAYYVCASDDYGTPILIQSEREKKTPQEYVAHWNRRAREDFESLDIAFDFFYRTSSPENVSLAQSVFEILRKNGHVYDSEIIQFYCEQDSKFLPDRYVRGKCPYCGAADQYSDLCEVCGRVPDEIGDPACSICGNPPVKRKTRHYFFRLGTFAKELSEWLDSNRNLQPDVKKYVQNWIDAGLIDWDITRDIPWGVPVPSGGQNQVFYGWFDNHLAYISSALKFLEDRGIDGREFWNSADIYHFIGKDIVYHHYLFLPAMRMGIGRRFKLPDYIPTRGHLTLESKKISKSRNWYIGLREFLRYYPSDYLRFYLLYINPYSQDDLNFDWDDFAARINSELIGNVGNFVNRALGFTARMFDGRVPSPENMTDADVKAHSRPERLCMTAGDLLVQNHIDRALKEVLGFSAYYNQYFQHSEPWKGGSSAATCTYLSVNATRSLAVALYPFLPHASSLIWDQLGLDGKVSDAPWDSISGTHIPAGHAIEKPSPLFLKVDQKDIASHKAKLGSHT